MQDVHFTASSSDSHIVVVKQPIAADEESLEKDDSEEDDDDDDDDDDAIERYCSKAAALQRQIALCGGRERSIHSRDRTHQAIFMWQIVLFMLQHPPEIPDIKIACTVILEEYLGSIAMAFDVFATSVTPSIMILSALGLKDYALRTLSSTEAVLSKVNLLSYFSSYPHLALLSRPMSNEYALWIIYPMRLPLKHSSDKSHSNDVLLMDYRPVKRYCLLLLCTLWRPLASHWKTAKLFYGSTSKLQPSDFHLKAACNTLRLHKVESVLCLAECYMPTWQERVCCNTWASSHFSQISL